MKTGAPFMVTRGSIILYPGFDPGDVSLATRSNQCIMCVFSVRPYVTCWSVLNIEVGSVFICFIASRFIENSISYFESNQIGAPAIKLVTTHPVSIAGKCSHEYSRALQSCWWRCWPLTSRASKRWAAITVAGTTQRNCEGNWYRLVNAFIDPQIAVI